MLAAPRLLLRASRLRTRSSTLAKEHSVTAAAAAAAASTPAVTPSSRSFSSAKALKTNPTAKTKTSTSSSSSKSSSKPVPAAKQKVYKSARVFAIKTKSEKLANATEPVEGDPYKYVRPTAPEEDKLYALALQKLADHRLEKEKIAEQLTKERDQLLKEGSPESLLHARAIDIKRSAVLVEAHIREPETEWNFFHGRYDLTNPVYYHLERKEFEKDVERTVKQLVDFKITQDLLPTPAWCKLDSKMEVSFGGATTSLRQQQMAEEPKKNPEVYARTSLTNRNFRILPDAQSFVPPRLMMKPPKLRVTPFSDYPHDKKLYSLLVVDADHPDLENDLITEKLHWLVTNIELDGLTCNLASLPENFGETIVPYLPPHPQKGTGVHRYTMLWMEQPSILDAKVLSYDGVNDRKETRQIKTQDFVKNNKLIIRGVKLFRSSWDNAVTQIHTKILGHEHEPVFGTLKYDKSIGRDGRTLPKFANM